VCERVNRWTGSQTKRNKRKHDDSASADSPSNRNPKIARSNSAAPVELLQVHAEVAYRLPKQKNAEGEWIQCSIIAISGEGSKRRHASANSLDVLVTDWGCVQI
jgi:SAGA-associated factor 29